jgi:hypothetical protein
MPVAATVVHYVLMAALITMLYPTSHCLSTASLQCMQSAQMMIGQWFLPMQLRQEILYDSCDLGLPGRIHEDGFVYNLSSIPKNACSGTLAKCK